jgi:hypothetical protein
LLYAKTNKMCFLKKLFLTLFAVAALSQCNKEKWACEYPSNIWPISSPTIFADVEKINSREDANKCSYYNIKIGALGHLFVRGSDNKDVNVESANGPSLEIIVDATGGGIATAGKKNYSYFIAQLNQDGSEKWVKRPGFQVNSILPVNLTNVNNGVMGVGYDGSSTKSMGGIVVYANNGNEIYNFSINDSVAPNGLWLNSIAFLNEANGSQIFIATGGGYIGENWYPYSCLLTYNSFNKKFTVIKSKLHTNFSRHVFVSLAKKNSTETVAVVGGEYINGKTNSRILVSINSDLSINTQTAVSAPYGTTSSLDRSLAYGDGAYLFYNENDQDKTPPTNGFWQSGKLLKFDNNHNLLWQSRILASTKTDEILTGTVYGNYIYLIGTMENSISLSYKDYTYYRGNGVVWKIDKSTGNTIKTSIYNPNGSCTGINDIVFFNDFAYMVGYTSYYTNDCGWKPFFIKVSNYKL